MKNLKELEELQKVAVEITNQVDESIRIFYNQK